MQWNPNWRLGDPWSVLCGPTKSKRLCQAFYRVLCCSAWRSFQSRAVILILQWCQSSKNISMVAFDVVVIEQLWSGIDPNGAKTITAVKNAISARTLLFRYLQMRLFHQPLVTVISNKAGAGVRCKVRDVFVELGSIPLTNFFVYCMYHMYYIIPCASFITYLQASFN